MIANRAGGGGWGVGVGEGSRTVYLLPLQHIMKLASFTKINLGINRVL